MENYIFWQTWGTIAKTLGVVFSVKFIGTVCFKKETKIIFHQLKIKSFPFFKYLRTCLYFLQSFY